MGVSGDQIVGAIMSNIPPLNLESYTRYQVHFCRRHHTDYGKIEYFWDAWAETFESLENAEAYVKQFPNAPADQIEIWKVNFGFERVKR